MGATAQGASIDTGVSTGDKVWLVRNANTIEVWDAPTGGSKIKTIVVADTSSIEGFGGLFEKVHVTCANNDGSKDGVMSTSTTSISFPADSCPSG